MIRSRLHAHDPACIQHILLAQHWQLWQSWHDTYLYLLGANSLPRTRPFDIVSNQKEACMDSRKDLKKCHKIPALFVTDQKAHMSSHKGYLEDVFPNMRHSWRASVGIERKVGHPEGPKLVSLAPGQPSKQRTARSRPVYASQPSHSLPNLSKISVKEKAIAANRGASDAQPAS